MHRAYITRASSGEGDNTPIIERTLALRREQAQLLGFDNYAEVSMASKVGDPVPGLQHCIKLARCVRRVCGLPSLA